MFGFGAKFYESKRRPLCPLGAKGSTPPPPVPWIRYDTDSRGDQKLPSPGEAGWGGKFSRLTMVASSRVCRRRRNAQVPRRYSLCIRTNTFCPFKKARRIPNFSKMTSFGFEPSKANTSFSAKTGWNSMVSSSAIKPSPFFIKRSG